MDVNEQIVSAWLQEQGFLVRGRLKFKVKGERKSAGYSDVDLIGYRLSDGKYVAVDISAWMTETITLSYLKEGSGARKRLLRICSGEARKEIRKYLQVPHDNRYDCWLVVSRLSKRQYNEEELLKHVDRVIEFREIMEDLINAIRKNPQVSGGWDPTRYTYVQYVI